MNYVLDVHTHTIASGHAYNTMREMAKAAADKGLELLGITEHAMAMPGTCHEYYFQNLKMVEREMYGTELLLGSEVNILDSKGNVDLEENIPKKAGYYHCQSSYSLYKTGNERRKYTGIYRNNEKALY